MGCVEREVLTQGRSSCGPGRGEGWPFPREPEEVAMVSISGLLQVVKPPNYRHRHWARALDFEDFDLSVETQVSYKVR